MDELSRQHLEPEGDHLHFEALPLSESIGIALLLADPLSSRLVESAAAQLGLSVTLFDAMPEAERLKPFELVVADEAAALDIRKALQASGDQGERILPALVAVRVTGQAVSTPSSRDLLAAASTAANETPYKLTSSKEQHFDGLLELPLTPAAVAAQLSLVVYSHRAFARHYQTALEELHLNRRIFSSVTSGISVANAMLPDLPLVYVNPAFEVMTGYCLEEVQGRNCRFLQHAETDPEAVTKLREAIREHREVVVVLKNFRKDGVAFWNELSLSPILNREGELTHFVGIQSDVTARVDFEAALRESEKLAAVGRLASSIAHEINNPLESVMNLLYLAQAEADTAGMRHYVELADRELKRVALITSQSLRFYKQSTRAQSIQASNLLESVLDMYEGKAINSGVTIELRERSASSLTCLESEIRQVLSNLVRNALDAMHGKGGRLQVRTRDATDWRDGRKGVLFTIADVGTGISAETRQKMFRPFFTTKGIAGTGLGLWISREIVERHDGVLKVSSSQRPGASGTVFELFLPLVGSLTA